MDLITIGRIIRPHGIDGTLKVLPLTDFPQHFESLEILYLIKGGISKTSLEKARFHKGYVFIKISQCCDRDMAEQWTGADIAIDSKDLWPLQDGEYYHFQIQGLKVITDTGECLGEVKEIIPTGGNDVYVVRNGRSECLLPAIREVVKSIDLENNVMIVHLLEGLID